MTPEERKAWRELERATKAATATTEGNYLIIDGCKALVNRSKGPEIWGITQDNTLVCPKGAEELLKLFNEYRQDTHPYFVLMAEEIYSIVTSTNMPNR